MLYIFANHKILYTLLYRYQIQCIPINYKILNIIYNN